MALKIPPAASDDFREASEINVTPFIDVILVLLIVFMIAAPLSTVNVPVNLPVSRASIQAAPPKPVIVSIRADKSLFVDDQPVSAGALAGALAKVGAQSNTRIFLRADKNLSYGDLMQFLDDLRAGGFTKVSLVAAEWTSPGQ